MASIVTEKAGSYLSSLSVTQVASILNDKHLGEYAEGVISQGVDGAYLETLTTSKKVKNSNLKSCGDSLSRSLLAKYVREFLTEAGESKLKEKFSGVSTETEEIIFEGIPGDLNLPVWETLYSVAQSPTGSKGVLFAKTKSGSFVLKAGDGEPVGEVFAEQLAVHLGIPVAKQRIATTAETRLIFSNLSELVQADNYDFVCDVQMKLWSWRQKKFISIIELVQNAESLKGMARKKAEMKLHPGTDMGAKRLHQLGELIAFDVFINNNDRVPALHRNVGNAENLLFCSGGGRNGQLIGIDSVVTTFQTQYEDDIEDEVAWGNDANLKSQNKTAWLYRNYIKSARAWASACLGFRKDNSAKVDKLPEANAWLKEELKEAHGISDLLAESCIRIAHFQPGVSHIVAQIPELLAYAKERGNCAINHEDGSLLCVRDFIARNTGYDVGEKGINIVRQGVCSCIKKIASMDKVNLDQMYRALCSDVIVKTDLHDLSEETWKCEVEKSIKLPFLEKMVEVFQSVVHK
jgi:hypothetical protein